MRKWRSLSKGELDLWRRATADVRPLDGKGPRRAEANLTAEAEGSTPKQPKAVGIKKPDKPMFGRAATPGAGARHGPIDIDRRSWERLKRGQTRIERTLDLHGRTQTEAHGALNHFLVMAQAAGLRTVLVVTGKGGLEGRGVLRRMVPRWLDEAENRDKVLSYCPAQPRHGGDGALYVLLRRRRNGRP